MIRKIILVLFVVALMGCGARKKTVQKTEVKTEMSSVSAIDAEKFSEITSKIKDQNTILQFAPVRVMHPMIIGRDTIYNTKIIYQNRFRDSVVTIRDTLRITKRDTIVLDQDVKIKERNVSRKGFTFPWFIVGMVLGGILIMYLMGFRIKVNKNA